MTGTTKRRGTKVTFKPDATIFETTVYSFDTLAQRLRELAFLNGGIVITLDPTVTEYLDPTIKYFYDVVITETATGFKTRVIQGTMKVSAGVTPVIC